jgi:predicted enzyme related to lactoylglutathione lyase
VAGDLVYFWLSLPDTERAKAFYGGLLGWQFSPGNAPDGWNVEGSSTPAGLGRAEGEARANLCFEVDDLEAGMAKVRELGGEADEPQPTEGGRFSICRDDQGLELCIWAGEGS